MIKDIHIFSPGTQTSAQGVTRSFSENDLKQIADTYDENTHEAPIRIGHEDNDKVPSWGWVKDVKMKGKDLYAEVEFSPLMEDYVKNGLYKKVSASFYSPESKINPEPGKWSLRHVAMLGAQPPAVKGLKGFAYSEASHLEEVFDFAVALTPDQVFDKELGPTLKRELSPFELLKEKLDEAREEMVKEEEAKAQAPEGSLGGDAQASDADSLADAILNPQGGGVGPTDPNFAERNRMGTEQHDEAGDGEDEDAAYSSKRPDYPDVDKDGDRKEPMAKALKEKKKGKVKRYTEDDVQHQEPTFDIRNEARPRKKRGSDSLRSSDTGVAPTAKSQIFYDPEEEYTEGAMQNHAEAPDIALRTGKATGIGGTPARHAKGYSDLSPEEVIGAGPVVGRMKKKPGDGGAMDDPVTLDKYVAAAESTKERIEMNPEAVAKEKEDELDGFMGYGEVRVPQGADIDTFKKGFNEALAAYIEAVKVDGELVFNETGDADFDSGALTALDFAADVERDGKMTALKPASDKQPKMDVEEGPVPKNLPGGKKLPYGKKQRSGMAPNEINTPDGDYKESEADKSGLMPDEAADGKPYKGKKSGNKFKEKMGKYYKEDEAMHSEDEKLKGDAKKDRKMAAKDESEAKYDKKRGKVKRADSLMRDADQDNRDADEDVVNSKEQGYDDRLDESLGMRNKGKKKQSMKDRRDESKGEEKAMGKRPYSGDKSMDMKDSEEHKEQGYDDRLDDSLGAKDKGKKSKQSMKSRRDESEGMEKSKGKRKFSGDKSMDMDEMQHAEPKGKNKRAKDAKFESDGGKERSAGRFQVGKPEGDSGKTGRFQVGKAGKSPEDGGDGFGRFKVAKTGKDGETGRFGKAAKSNEQTIGRNKTGKAGKDGATGRYSHTKMLNTGGPKGSGAAMKSGKVRVEQIRSGETPGQVAAEYSEFAERLQELEAANARLVQEKQAAEMKAHRMQVEDFAESLYAHGKLTDSVIAQDELVDYMVDLEYGTLQFAEGEHAASKLQQILANLPGMVSYAEVAAAPASKEMPFEDMDPHSQALKVSQEQGISYEDALKRALYS